MRGFRMRAGLPAAVAIVLFTNFLLVGRGEAGPLFIQPGQDGFVTTPGTEAPISAIPAGFFGDLNGTPSDALAATDIPMESGPNLVALLEVTTVLFDEGCHSHPLGTDHCYEQMLETVVPIYDTVIERTGGTIDNQPGSLMTTVEIVHLSLASISPLEVTYGAEGSLFYDVEVGLDEARGAQDPGELLLNRTFDTGGTMDTNLPVRYLVTFTEVGGPREFSLVEDASQASTGNTWEVAIPTVSEWGMLVMVLLALAAGTVVFRRFSRQVA